MAVCKIPTGTGQLLFAEHSAWGAAATPATGIEAWDIKWDPKRSILPVDVQSVYASRGPKAMIAGAQGGTLSFKIMLRGGNGAESKLSLLLKNCGMARGVTANLSAKVTAAAAGNVAMLDADATSISVGELICVGGASTDTQIRSVTRKVSAAGTTTLTIAPNWTDTPGAGDSLYAVDTFTPAIGEPTKYLSFYYYVGQYATAGTSPYYQFNNCAGTWKIGTVGANALPFVEFTFNVDNWAYVSAAAPTLTVDAFTAAHPLIGDKCLIDGTSTNVASVGFDPGQKLQPYAATVGTHGRMGWLYNGVDPKLEFTPYFDDTWVSTRFSGAASFTFMMESIKGTTNFWALWCPSCYMTDINLDDAGNQHVGHKPTITLADPGLDGDAATPLPRFALAVSGVGT